MIKNKLVLFRSKYCIFVFGAALVGSYYLVPEKIFYGPFIILGILYILIFSLTFTCIIWTIKEKVVNLKNAGAGIVSIIAAVLGIGAMQVCTVGAPICGASVGLGLFSLFMPTVSQDFMNDHAVVLIIVSIAVQLAALYYMKCFKSRTVNYK
jgi:hypothetical protein